MYIGHLQYTFQGLLMDEGIIYTDIPYNLYLLYRLITSKYDRKNNKRMESICSHETEREQLNLRNTYSITEKMLY